MALDRHWHFKNKNSFKFEDMLKVNINIIWYKLENAHWASRNEGRKTKRNWAHKMPQKKWAHCVQTFWNGWNLAAEYQWNPFLQTSFASHHDDGSHTVCAWLDFYPKHFTYKMMLPIRWESIESTVYWVSNIDVSMEIKFAIATTLASKQQIGESIPIWNETGCKWKYTKGQCSQVLLMRR